MARGGFRANAGRKPDPNSKRQQALARRAAKKSDPGRGLTLPNGEKSPDAPPGWPFGTKPAETPAEPKLSFKTPLEYWEYVLGDPGASASAKAAAAFAMAPYVHAKLAPALKKEEARSKAKEAGQGRFKAAPAPLALVKR